jgi:uncharacterized damage-inducible protein DinB
VSGRDNPYHPGKGDDPAERDEFKQSKAAVTDFITESYDFVISAIESLTDTQLDEPVQFYKRMLRRDVLSAKAMEHHAHHRGQMAIYLRLRDIKPPSERLF